MQRYEATGYRAASLALLCDVAEALNVIVTERAGSPRRPDRRLTTRACHVGSRRRAHYVPRATAKQGLEGSAAVKAPQDNSPYLSGTLSLKLPLSDRARTGQIRL